MTKVLKNRSENDIKNKWNSMKRTRNRRKNNKKKRKSYDSVSVVVDNTVTSREDISPIVNTSNNEIPFDIISFPVEDTSTSTPTTRTTTLSTGSDLVHTESNLLFDFTTDLEDSIDALCWNTLAV
jgi:hypothetical protein